MVPESLAIFPSETEHDSRREPVAVPVYVRAQPARHRTGAGRVMIAGAVVMAGLTGTVLRQPVRHAPPEQSNQVFVPGAVPVRAAQPTATSGLSAAASVPAPAPPSVPRPEPPAIEAAPIKAVPIVRKPAAVPAPIVETRPARELRSSGAARTPAFKGTLIVESVPAGATVLINQRPAGVTPLRLPNYPAGSYAVWVEREGFQRWTAGVRVPADTTTLVNPILRSVDQ